MGVPWAFIVACVIIATWAFSGPAFGFSDTWQLVINTGTTIVTFLMVFLIQNTQNRDAKAIQLKLDELIRAVNGARTGLVGLEELTDQQLGTLQEQFLELHDEKAVADAPSVTIAQKTTRKTTRKAPGRGARRRTVARA
jgi:low affinity Fe/Cu permease